MHNTKTQSRFYTFADFQEEETWLREQHRQGWKLTKIKLWCFHFEKCEPEDMVYRLDYKNQAENEEYLQMLRDFGWEYCGKCAGWLYFRKRAADISNENDGELFSDNASKASMIRHIMKTRLLPVSCIFLCCVVPNAIRAFDSGENAAWAVFWMIMMAIYVYLLVHCGLKLRKMSKETEE